MRKIAILLFFFVTIYSIPSFSQSKGFGLGVIVGEPTGVSAKYWTTSSTALDFGLGYSFEKNSRLHLHADYLFHVNNLFETTENLALYYGPGARLRIVENGDSRLGFRFDVGLVWIPKNAPIDVFIEIAPLLDIIPETDFSFNGGLGVRFFFN
jgi:hypothetical protein